MPKVSNVGRTNFTQLIIHNVENAQMWYVIDTHSFGW